MERILISVVLAALLLQPASLHLTKSEFSDFLEPLCFNNKNNADILLVNGQEVPLASTLENFINLVEKFEAANPTTPLEEEVLFLMRNFTYENFVFSPRGLIFPWTPNSADYTLIKNLWEPDESRRVRIPQVEDPFTDQEKCSLFFMLSHTVLEQAMKVSRSPERVYVNASWESIMRSDGNVEDLYPQELGVVAIHGTDQAVSLSRVLNGLYIGLKTESQRRIEVEALKKATNYRPQSSYIDPLYAYTLAEVLVIAQWPFEEEKRDLLGRNGIWTPSPSLNTLPDTQDVCPVIYKLPEATKSAYTFSSVRGAADGLILGQTIYDLNQQRSNLRLSQVLRMYYNPRGVRTQDHDISYSFCNRAPTIELQEDDLKNQMEVFAFLISSDDKTTDTALKESWDYYKSLKNDIYGDYRVLQNMCPQQPNGKDPAQKYHIETPLDILVVLDSVNSVDKQQIIIGHLASNLDFRFGGSSITVFLDQRIVGSGTNIYLKPAVNETSSAACAACLITQKITDLSAAADKDVVIQAIDEALRDQKKKEENQHGVAGKIVIYFNLADDEKENFRLTRALRALHLAHQDVSMYAVGKETEVLKKYVRNDVHHVISSADEPKEVAQSLYDKLITDPAILQYTDCQNAKSENGAIFEEYVSPYTIQHWAMPSKYFLKSLNAKVTFETEYGNLLVCHSRGSSSPEVQMSNCINITTLGDKKKEFKFSNPCQGFSETNCAPFYFSVMAVNGSDTTQNSQFQYCQDTRDVKCKTLDQVKFKVTHDGIRCSGCFGLVSSPMLMSIGLLLVLSKWKKW